MWVLSISYCPLLRQEPEVIKKLTPVQLRGALMAAWLAHREGKGDVAKRAVEHMPTAKH